MSQPAEALSSNFPALYHYVNGEKITASGGRFGDIFNPTLGVNSAWCSYNRCRYLVITRERFNTDVAAHAGKAASASAMADSTSDFEASGTSADLTPRVGLNISPKRPPLAVIFSPLT